MKTSNVLFAVLSVSLIATFSSEASAQLRDRQGQWGQRQWQERQSEPPRGMEIALHFKCNGDVTVVHERRQIGPNSKGVRQGIARRVIFFDNSYDYGTTKVRLLGPDYKDIEVTALDNDLLRVRVRSGVKLVGKDRGALFKGSEILVRSMDIREDGWVELILQKENKFEIHFDAENGAQAQCAFDSNTSFFVE